VVTLRRQKKITWIAISDQITKVKLIYYDNIINVPSIPKDKKADAKKIDFEQFINYDSKKEVMGLAEPCVKDVKIGESIQFTRRGYYILDSIEEDNTYVFVSTPDGHMKDVWI